MKRPTKKYSVRKEICLIAIIAMIGSLLATFNVPQAQAFGLTGKTTYSIRFTAQAGIYLVYDVEDGVPGVRGCVLIATGDNHPGPTEIRSNNVYFTTLNPDQKDREKVRKNGRVQRDKDTYEFFIPLSCLRTDGLPNNIEAYAMTYKPYSKDPSKDGKLQKKWGAAASATFVLQKQQIHSDAEEEQIARANAEAQLGRTDSADNGSDADALASFFGNSANASASASASSDSSKSDGSAHASAQASASVSAAASSGVQGVTRASSAPVTQTEAPATDPSLKLTVVPGIPIIIQFYDYQGNQLPKVVQGNTMSNLVVVTELPYQGKVVITHNRIVTTVPVSAVTDQPVDCTRIHHR